MNSVSTSAALKIFIVDDHPMLRASLRLLFGNTPGLVLCGEAGSCEEALRLIPAANPDLVTVDVELCGANGFELIRSLKQLNPEIRTIVFSMHEETRFVLRSIKEGAQGYVLKSANPPELLEAVFKAARGELAISPAVEQGFLQSLAENESEQKRPDLVLSGREWQAFELLGAGLTIKETAAQLHVSEKTASTYCDRIKSKLSLPRLRDVATAARAWFGKELRVAEVCHTVRNHPGST